MKKNCIPHISIRATVAVLAAAVALLAPASTRATDTQWANGGNWSSEVGIVTNVIQYPDGMTSGTTTTQAAALADDCYLDYMILGMNFVRYPINPATVSDPTAWARTQAAINELVADGLDVDICCWYVNPQPKGNGLIWALGTWQSMWETIDSVYQNNTKVYYEPINEPSGYSVASLETNVYMRFLGFINKEQDHILLDGNGFAENVTNIGSYAPLGGCLLAIHAYPTWANNTTDADWANYLKVRLGTYADRTIMTEFAGPADTGLNYGESGSGNNDICFIRGMCDQCLTDKMGSVYFPTFQNSTNQYRLMTGINGTIYNTSLVDELMYGFGEN